MYSTRNKKQRMIVAIIIVLVLYCCLILPYNVHKQEEVIKNVKPERVWEYVADFSKMKSLNPTILDFKVTADHGTFEDWNYSVEYFEKLSYYPNWVNKNIGHFSVKKTTIDGRQTYLIESNHKTCFFFNLYCLKSIGEFQFIGINNDQDTHCTEKVKYQCPPLMGRFCRREVEYQRKAIMANLVYHFKNNISIEEK